jgi:cell division protein FtsZ
VVDTLLIIPNQNLFRVGNEKTTIADAFAMADQVLLRVWPASTT